MIGKSCKSLPHPEAGRHEAISCPSSAHCPLLHASCRADGSGDHHCVSPPTPSRGVSRGPGQCTTAPSVAAHAPPAQCLSPAWHQISMYRAPAPRTIELMPQCPTECSSLQAPAGAEMKSCCLPDEERRRMPVLPCPPQKLERAAADHAGATCVCWNTVCQWATRNT